jgi:2-methylcitrate dehydratase PrpD
MKRRQLVHAALGLPALAAGVNKAGQSAAAPGGSGAGTAHGAGAATCAEVPFPQSPGLTKYVCEFIVETKPEDIPESVQVLAKKSILDGFGLALAGSVSVLGPIARKYVQSLDTEGPATVIGTSMKLPARFAAFLNGISIHADDYDDTQLSVAKDRIYGLLTHPTAPVLPPAFALCEAGRRSGRDLLLAYNLGVEVECKIAEAISPRHYGDGFHTTGTVGALGSAVACARLRGLDAERTAHALGVAATEGGGFRNNFGSMTKPFHAGHAAEAGPVAADLAALGWTASTNILEAPRGFFQAEGGGYDPSAIVGKLGKPWSLEKPGVSIKPHPSGSLSHPAAFALLGLVQKNDVKPEDVEQIEVGGNHGMTTSLFHHQPTTGLQAKFSMEFGMAILVLRRRAGLAEFTDAVVQSPEVQAMMKKVRFYMDPVAESGGFDKMTSLVKIHLRGGKVLTARADFAKGSPSNPMSYDEAADKFRGCAEFARWPKAKAEAVIAQVKTLESAKDLSQLTAALSA